MQWLVLDLTGSVRSRGLGIMSRGRYGLILVRIAEMFCQPSVVHPRCPCQEHISGHLSVGPEV